MFPWESAEDGSEDTVWALTGPFQQHITATVGWAFGNILKLQDLEWLRSRGYPVLCNILVKSCGESV